MWVEGVVEGVVVEEGMGELLREEGGVRIEVGSGIVGGKRFDLESCNSLDD